MSRYRCCFKPRWGALQDGLLDIRVHEYWQQLELAVTRHFAHGEGFGRDNIEWTAGYTGQFVRLPRIGPIVAVLDSCKGEARVSSDAKANVLQADMLARLLCLARSRLVHDVERVQEFGEPSPLGRQDVTSASLMDLLAMDLIEVDDAWTLFGLWHGILAALNEAEPDYSPWLKAPFILGADFPSAERICRDLAPLSMLERNAQFLAFARNQSKRRYLPFIETFHRHMAQAQAV